MTKRYPCGGLFCTDDDRSADDIAKHGKHADMVGLGVHRGAQTVPPLEGYAAKHRAPECLRCGYSIKQVAGLWIHQDRRAYEYPRHIAEPTRTDGRSAV